MNQFIQIAAAVERRIEIHAPVQDALLVGRSADEIEHIVAATQEVMAQASDLVLHGFILRSDVKIIESPDRYFDDPGVEMWNRAMRLLGELELFDHSIGNSSTQERTA